MYGPRVPRLQLKTSLRSNLAGLECSTYKNEWYPKVGKMRGGNLHVTRIGSQIRLRNSNYAIDTSVMLLLLRWYLAYGNTVFTFSS